MYLSARQGWVSWVRLEQLAKNLQMLCQQLAKDPELFCNSLQVFCHMFRELFCNSLQVFCHMFRMVQNMDT